jgi:hypothetical protein
MTSRAWRLILSRLQATVRAVRDGSTATTRRALAAVEDFVRRTCQLGVRHRRQFGRAMTAEKAAAYRTLHHVLRASPSSPRR